MRSNLDVAMTSAFIQIDNGPVLKFNSLFELVSTTWHVPSSFWWPNELFVGILHVWGFQNTPLQFHHVVIHSQSECIGDLKYTKLVSVSRSNKVTYGVIVDIGFMNPLFDFTLTLISWSSSWSNQCGQLLIAKFFLITLFSSNLEQFHWNHLALSTNFDNWQEWVS